MTFTLVKTEDDWFKLKNEYTLKELYVLNYAGPKQYPCLIASTIVSPGFLEFDFVYWKDILPLMFEKLKDES